MTVSACSSNPKLDDIYKKIGFGKFHVLVIIILGSCQFFDAVEMILLSFLGPILNCSWEITLLESSFIPIAVFIGMICGSLLLGKLSDSYGRKMTFIVCACGIIYFSLLSALSPTFMWMVISRSFTGVFIGGTTTMISTFLAEIIPATERGSSLMCVQLFWPLGSFYVSILTMSVVPNLGWRLWLFFTSIPMMIIVFLLMWLPESPRYLLIKNRVGDALVVINRIAKMNKKDYVSNIKYVECKRSSFLDLFHRNYALTTVVMIYIWFVTGISYYGIVLSSSIINSIPHYCLQNISALSDPFIYANKSIDNSCCVTLSWSDMYTVLISITGELVSYVIAISLVRFIRRKLYLQLLLSTNAIVFILLNLCLPPNGMGFLMLFGRGSAATLFGISYLYTSEVFPTTIRGLALGLGNGSARLGAMFSSLIVNMLMVKTSFFSGTIFYFVINIIACLMVFLLPYETKGRPLMQSVEEEITELEMDNISRTG